MSAVQWKMELLDRVSGTANRILARVERLEAVQERATRATRAATSAWDAWGRAGEGAAKRVGTAFDRAHRRIEGNMQSFGRMQGALGTLAFAAAPAIGAAFLGKRGLDMMGQREGSLESLSVLLKTRDQAQVRSAAAWVDNFADVTPFEDPQVMGSVRQLLAAQFKFDDVKRLSRITGDAASALGNDPADSAFKWQIINRALGQIKAKGRLQGDELLQLNEAGIGTDKYLQKAFGPNYRKLQEAGRISGAAAIKAITEGLEQDFGGAMERQSKTFFGLASTLKSRPQRVMGRLFDEGGLDDAKRFLQNLVTLTDFSRPPGSRILTRLAATGKKLTRALFGPLADATEGARGEQVITRLLDRLDEFSGWWEDHGPRIAREARGFGEGLQVAGRGAETLMKPLLGLAGLADRAAGGDGEGMLGKILGIGVGAAVLGRVANFLSFGMLGKIGGKAGTYLLGGLRTAWMKAGQTLLTRGILGELLTNPGGLVAGARVALGSLGGVQGIGALVVNGLRAVPVIGWIVTGLVAAKAAGDGLYRSFAGFAQLMDDMKGHPLAKFFLERPEDASTWASRAAHFDPVKWVTGQQQAWETGNSGFQAKLAAMAARLGISPEDLLMIMNKESSLNPQAIHKNKQGRVTAAGLIQFQEASAQEVGTSISALRNMNREDQLEYIEKYLLARGVKPGMGLEQVYMAVLAGHASKAGGVLWTRGSDEYASNEALDTDKDGKITSAEATKSVEAAWARDGAYQIKNLNLTINAPGGDPQQVQQGVMDGLARMGLEMGYGGPPG